ncbi:methyltransferase family protein [Chitinophaga pinensis]|uniref:Isoprenylcysteine carboxyl methyltransferase n=1 Tax=Chitinophaga pinensis (strain ATCC 43595 / DSM 2588 / LMG 13176 / NBRC 15968 / NCIMB 11800 / UQM 2034) TaxID=485918 RepID=A0A979G056_CHIPD|nr:isoprenylcysteine carboxylmethyltransferase family protein [Chitinophaga pinensis]ACU58261.1 Isoprenylcysteine carboxyl methyltransferase [Chitinophaga pinensis DSM 2588]
MYETLHQIIAAIWILSEVLLNRLVRSSQSDKTRADKQSLRFIWITIMIALPLAHILSRQFHVLPISSSPVIVQAGLIMIVVGMIYRFIAIYTLGRFFTVDVAIRSDHRIVRKGMYRFMRHPSYLGSLLSFLGNGFALNSWVGLVIGFVPVLLTFLYRMKVEEELLVNNFGQEYIDYKKDTWKLIPFVY